MLQRLKDLDPNRLYFLASDIKDFQRYNEILDDQLRKGQLEGSSFAIASSSAWKSA